MDKVLRTFPIRFDVRVSYLKERKDLDTITMDELHGILTAYEMRAKIDQSRNKEVSFKDSKKIRKDKHTSRTDCSDESNGDGANFIKMLTRGSSKHKGKLPYKCFNCGEIGHLLQNVVMQNMKTKVRRNDIVEGKERKRSSKRGERLETRRRVSTQKRIAHLMSKIVTLILTLNQTKSCLWP